MRTEEFKVEKNTGHIAPVSTSDSIAHVEETKRRAHAEQITIEKEAAHGVNRNGHAEGNVLIDLGLEALGVKTASSLVQFADERMTDKAGRPSSNNDSLGGLIDGITKTIDDDILERTNRQPGSYEGIFERAQIAASSLDLDPKHVNTDIWNGTDTKLQGVMQTRDMAFRKEIEHDLLPQIRGVEMQHQAMLGYARMRAPGLSMDGPSINPQKLLNEAERAAELEDWQRRMQEVGGAA